MTESAPEAPTTETPSETPAPVQLPDDHPLVKTLAEQKKAIKDLKSRSARLDEIEESQKTEAEKSADRIAKAEAEVAAVPSKVAEALREHLVALHQIEKDDADLFLTGAEPELLLKQVNRLLAQTEGRKKNGNYVPSEGNVPTSIEGEGLQTVRALFGGG